MLTRIEPKASCCKCCNITTKLLLAKCNNEYLIHIFSAFRHLMPFYDQHVTGFSHHHTERQQTATTIENDGNRE